MGSSPVFLDREVIIQELNHILSLNIDRGWRKKAVREIVDTEKPIKVLDVACGTADFTIEIAQKTSF